MSNPNMLILDEPTNDLDILTLNVLEDFLMEFPGVVILASHDRYMLDKLADHLFVLEGDGFIKDFPGGYTAYSVYKENQVNATDVIPDEKDNQHETQTAADRQEVRKALRRAEKSIEQLEKTKKKLEENFLSPDPSLSDLQRWDRELKETVSQLSELEIKWMELAEQIETI
jgi:ATP-binding cassette subfamily F protein uup